MVSTMTFGRGKLRSAKKMAGRMVDAGKDSGGIACKLKRVRWCNYFDVTADALGWEALQKGAERMSNPCPRRRKN